MRGIMIRYKVKPDQADSNEELVRAVYDELGRAQPAGFRYATFRLDGGPTFVHLAWTDTANGGSPLAEIRAFQRFQEGIADRCEEAPVVAELQEVGSFRFFEVT